MKQTHTTKAALDIPNGHSPRPVFISPKKVRFSSPNCGEVKTTLNVKEAILPAQRAQWTQKMALKNFECSPKVFRVRSVKRKARR